MASLIEIRTALAAASLVLVCASAYAQGDTGSKAFCLTTGSLAPEAIGDREGHMLQTAVATCRLEGGAMDKGVMTTEALWEMDKGSSSLVASTSVVRAPGLFAVSQTTSGTRTLTLKDGKVVGWSASGKSVYLMASGAASALVGKSMSWTAKPTGLHQYVMDISLD